MNTNAKVLIFTGGAKESRGQEDDDEHDERARRRRAPHEASSSMAAESAALSEPHRDSAKNPAEQLPDVPLVAAVAHYHTAPAAPHHQRKAPRRLSITATTEKTPLVLKIDTSRHTQAVEDEQVYPLPWFRSPEWARRSPLTNHKDRGSTAATRAKRSCNGAAHASAATWCFGTTSSSSTRDVELGYSSNYRRRVLATADDDADGFRQCIQFLVALIIVVAMALIFMVIFEPFRERSATAAAAAAAGEDDGGW